jgi:hypothetical protein
VVDGSLARKEGHCAGALAIGPGELSMIAVDAGTDKSRDGEPRTFCATCWLLWLVDNEDDLEKREMEADEICKSTECKSWHGGPRLASAHQSHVILSFASTSGLCFLHLLNNHKVLNALRSSGKQRASCFSLQFSTCCGALRGELPRGL